MDQQSVKECCSDKDRSKGINPDDAVPPDEGDIVLLEVNKSHQLTVASPNVSISEMSHRRTATTQVSAENKETGNKAQITITHEQNILTPDEIERMLKDAEKFAEDDNSLNERVEGNPIEYVQINDRWNNDSDEEEAKIEEAIKEELKTKCISFLKEMSDTCEFYTHYKKNIYDGMQNDPSNRRDLAHLLRLPSSKSDGLTSLECYVSRMKPRQRNIYYLSGNKESAKLLNEKMKDDVEIVYVEESDSWVDWYMHDFAGVTLANANSGQYEVWCRLESQRAVDAEVKSKAKGAALIPKVKKAPSSVLSVSNISPPFTNQQLQQLLGCVRGRLTEGGLWVAKDQSWCIVVVSRRLALRKGSSTAGFTSDTTDHNSSKHYTSRNEGYGITCAIFKKFSRSSMMYLREFCLTTLFYAERPKKVTNRKKHIDHRSLIAW